MTRDTSVSFRCSMGILAALVMVLSLCGTGSALKQPHLERTTSATGNHSELNTTLAQ